MTGFMQRSRSVSGVRAAGNSCPLSIAAGTNKKYFSGYMDDVSSVWQLTCSQCMYIGTHADDQKKVYQNIHFNNQSFEEIVTSHYDSML